ncbi:hybrid sensor histidine kinase/response regulator [Verrucomicrobium sp. GAS474]|uniref:PAS domain-containing hybrid sensor histidine kinase/response regulator n=1 Tax=Verrucomicrobium sp. GAS474 TaxID=1882831 RepID=UPI0013900A07|nr:hybrid sensor histidine kinase/response regulator [Verrucomicrobium sp. GAS474]
MPASDSPLSLILTALGLTQEAYLIITPDTGDDHDPESGRVTFINPAFTRLTGYTADELQGRSTTLLFQPEIAALQRQSIRETLRRREAYVRDILLPRKDGRPVWIELQIVPVDAGTSPHWVFVVRDISERKLTEQSLLESQMRLNGILNSLSDVVWSTSLDFDRFIYLSPSTEKVFGRPVEDFYHDASLWFSSIHPEDRDRVRDLLTGVVARNEDAFEIDYRIVRPEGDIRWLRNRGRTIRNRTGKPAHLDGIADDITADKNTEIELERMANFSRFNPNPVYELTPGGHATYSNSAALKLAQSLGHEAASEILPPETDELVARCLEKREPILRHETTHGERTVSWSFFPVPGERAVHCYAGEITDKLRLERQLHQSEKLKSIGQLAGGIAHDFNNILTVIQGFTELLLAREEQDAAVVDQLTQISVSAERAQDLTRQLLMFSRRQVMKPTILDVSLIVRDMAKMLSRLVGEQIELKILPATGAIPVEADRSMVEQIVLNLVANARDAMPVGGTIWLSSEIVTLAPEDVAGRPEARPGRFALLTAKDTGTGMDERTLTRIFEPFFTTKEMGKGTGLGLATVYGVVKQHEGWIEVDSVLGSGTTFHIYLPLSGKVSDVVPGAKAVKPLGGSETILVVEDETHVRQLVVAILKTAGYGILEAKSGLDAIGVWEKNIEKIDLVLSDVIMPGLITGIDLGEKLASEKPGLPVILTSGYSAEVIGENLALDSSINFLPKPYPPHSLLRMVRDCLDKKPSVAAA